MALKKLVFITVGIFIGTLASANFVYLEKEPTQEKTLKFFSKLNEILDFHSKAGGETVVVRYLNRTTEPFKGVQAVNKDFESLESEIAEGTKDLGRERVFVWVQKSANVGFVGADYGLDYVLDADFLEKTRDDILMEHLDHGKPLRAILETVKAILIQLDSPVLLPENVAVQSTLSTLDTLAEPLPEKKPLSTVFVFFQLLFALLTFAFAVYVFTRTEIHINGEGFSKKHVFRSWIDRYRLMRNQTGEGKRGEACGSW